MVKTLGVVEVRPNADLPRLMACRRLGGKSLLEWTVRRMTECLRLDRVLVLCPRIPQTRELMDLVPRDVPLAVSDRPDALARLVDMLEKHPAESVVVVAAEHPFVDPELIDRLIITADHYPESDYISFCSRTGLPTVLSPLGLMASGCGPAHCGRPMRKPEICPIERAWPAIWLRGRSAFSCD
ncbi:MAG TPA: NTP transferase domain-containing protein [Pirellulales bacterium]|jgi:spore coat polysaccharide biosynthesis protein SpsF (cytidylyltransferase family)|nr:NTP transferase domain-containing protein [Pirellulales bacterium]